MQFSLINFVEHYFNKLAIRCSDFIATTKIAVLNFFVDCFSVSYVKNEFNFIILQFVLRFLTFQTPELLKIAQMDDRLDRLARSAAQQEES